MRTPSFVAVVGFGHWRSAVVAAVLVGGVPAGLSAQEAEPAGVETAPDFSRWQISGNPFLLLAEWFAGEVEYAPGESVGFGLTFSHFKNPDDSDETATGVNAMVRYYPGKKRLRGFYFGSRVGWYSVDELGTSNDGSSFAFGVDVGYNWIFGESDGFYLGLGGGLTRLFDSENLDLIPIVRLVNVGWSF